ncbi:MAG TPA: class I SAM-dependent methyltransferase [Solirubrobacterales bacterium]|nr:class I SAM-dependent methyltransferase [Solirubrobacterales bacterium]
MSHDGQTDLQVDTTNYAKFQTGNPVVRRMIDRFYGVVSDTIHPLSPASVLDAGCGEGETLMRLRPELPARPVGIDLNDESVRFAQERLPYADLRHSDVMNMDFDDGEFDLVLCLEVLEHLDRPGDGLRSIARVCRRDLVISVPHEPWFRLGSLARGKYIRTWGNHPEHVNHWNPRTLRGFLESQVEVVEVTGSMPWLIAHCRPSS